MGTFTINIPPMLAYIPYMDPMGTVSIDIPAPWILYGLTITMSHRFASDAALSNLSVVRSIDQRWEEHHRYGEFTVKMMS
jgi:hypothetical protein